MTPYWGTLWLASSATSLKRGLRLSPIWGSTIDVKHVLTIESARCSCTASCIGLADRAHRQCS